MTPKEIEQLKADRFTDAAIEEEFFHQVGHRIHLAEYRGEPLRVSRKFSTDPTEALKILDAAPGWQMWYDDGKICVNLSFKIGGTSILVSGIGRDESFCLAICKAALMLMWQLRECRNVEDRFKSGGFWRA